MILGCGGSGKSTLSRQLHQITQLPIIPLDKMYWKPNWVTPSEEEWRNTISELVTQDKWIMEGNYGGTWDLRIPRADTIIYLDMPTRVCLYRVLKRTFANYGKVRPDMVEGCPERLDWEFIHYILTFNLTRRKRNISIINQYKEEKQILIFRKKKELNAFLNSLS